MNKEISVPLKTAKQVALKQVKKSNSKNKDEINFFFSQGENWHRLRTVTAPKMLKMKEALDFCGPMNDVGNDFMEHLADIREANNEVNGLEKEIFKWAFECKISLLVG